MKSNGKFSVVVLFLVSILLIIFGILFAFVDTSSEKGVTVAGKIVLSVLFIGIGVSSFCYIIYRIKVKNKTNVSSDLNNWPTNIFLIAALFIAFGAFLAIHINAGDPEDVVPKSILAILFFVVGTLFLIDAIYQTFVITKYNKLLRDTMAYVTTASLISTNLSGTSFMGFIVNLLNSRYSKREIYKKIKYSYFDEKGKFHIEKSVLSFAPNQIAFLENKSEIKIKCRGSTSVITEDLPAPIDDVK